MTDPAVAIIVVLLGGGILAAIVNAWRAKPQNTLDLSNAWSTTMARLEAEIERLSGDLDDERKLRVQLAADHAECPERIQSLEAQVADLTARLT